MSQDAQVSSSSAPTLEDVARVAGVSRATVSRVVNGVRNVDPAIQEAVRAAVTATGYRPNRAARSLVTRRAETIALVVSGAGGDSPEEQDAFAARAFGDPFFGRVVSGVIGYLRPHGMHPVLMFAETAAARAEVVAYLRQGSADGALVVSTHAEDPLPPMLAEAGLAAVLFARPARPVPLSYVDLDHRDGGRAGGGAAARAGQAAPGDDRGAAGRTGGAGAAGRVPGRDGAGRPTVRAGGRGGFTARSGAEAMARLLADHPDLDAVFAANDLMAEGACRVLLEQGRRVPEDVAVVGFDDSPAATACRPPLTTVRQPVEDMAAEMARLLRQRIEAPGTPVTSAVFDPELVVRESA